jgi:hypothetical protein
MDVASSRSREDVVAPAPDFLPRAARRPKDQPIRIP